MDTILIIGCCGRIGSEVLKQLIEQKSCRIIGCDINSERINSLQEMYKASCYSDIHLLTLNVNSKDGFDALQSYMKEHKLTPNGAVYAAFPQDAWSRKREDIPNKDRISNYLGDELSSIILFCSLILDYFSKERGGSLVLLSSIMGIKAPKFENYKGTNMTSPVEYTAAKAATVAIAKWYSKYYFNSNIRVNTVSFGGIKSNQPDSFLKRYRDCCNNIGMLDSKHVVGAINFLLLDKSQAITGQNIIVDDGWTC